MISFKSFLHFLYRQGVGATSCINNIMIQKNNVSPALFYGGARGGHKGGPQVKLSLLENYFPERRINFNLLYLLSGALYMPTWAIHRFKDSGIPVVLNQNGVFYPAWSPHIWEYENTRMAEALELSSHVFYQSEFCKNSADKFLGVTAKSYDILYNAVDTNYFLPKEKVRDNNHTFKFLMTGNINHSTSYRIFNAIDALYSARKQGLNIEIYFFGILPSDVLIDLKKHIQNYNLCNFFKISGPYSRNQAPQIFSNFDAYIMTKHNDPCPNVVLEAMSCGLPILHVSSGGTPELVGDVAGYCLKVDESFEVNSLPSINDMVVGMSYIMSNVEDLSVRARTRVVEKFDIKKWIDRHSEVFQKFFADRVV